MKVALRTLFVRIVTALFGRGVGSCLEVNRLVSEGRDRPLTRKERLCMRLHNLLCIECHRYERQLHLLGHVARDEKPLPPLPEEAKRKLAEALRREDGKE